MQTLSRKTVFGVPFISSDLEEASNHWVELAQQCHEAHLIAHADVHVLTRILHEAKDYGAGIQEHFSYICPDGMPIVWELRKKRPQSERLYGPDVMELMWNKGRQAQLRHFILGGSDEARVQCANKLGERFPGAELAGMYSPPMGEWPAEEHEKIAKLIKESGAHCVWVCLGCPKQERWLFEQKAKGILPPALYYAVGAAVNFHAGMVKQAPAWIRARGFEWLYRLCCEPRRLFKRYLIHNSRFIWYKITRKV